ncbi:MAG: MBL fold metallo-hydrolase [Bacteroidales bacterium]|nr:MBL fold metallo-hydrolase [Bacteroidales bacterium]
MLPLRYLPVLGALLIVGCTTTPKQEVYTPVITKSDLPCDIIDDEQTAVYCLQDNAEPKLMPTSLFPDAPDSLIQQLGVQDGVPSSISTFLMYDHGEWSLFDTGLGADHGGQLLTLLQRNGLQPDSISRIYLTHFHGDHIGGMMQGDAPLFTHAQVYANHLEYMHWIFNQTETETPQQHKVMAAYRDQVQLFAWGDSLPGGVVAIEAPGHTPGHTVFRKGNLLILGDLMHGFQLQYNHRYISCKYDMDPEKAAQTRNHIISIAHNEHLTICGMHLPAPSFFEVNPVSTSTNPKQ